MNDPLITLHCRFMVWPTYQALPPGYDFANRRQPRPLAHYSIRLKMRVEMIIGHPSDRPRLPGKIEPTNWPTGSCNTWSSGTMPKGHTTSSRTRRASCELTDHFRATSTGQVRGIHVASADEICRVVVLDGDNHTHDPIAVPINRAFALAACDEARALGFSPLLVDGNGEGSFHLWVPLGRETPMRDACRLAQWLARNWREAGLPKQPDRFPANPQHSSERRMGPWVRLPGRHHKRPVWG